MRENLTNLTEREKQVAKLIASGVPSKEIADMLFVSMNTVKTHRENLMSKIDAHDRLDVEHWAIKEGLIACPCSDKE